MRSATCRYCEVNVGLVMQSSDITTAARYLQCKKTKNEPHPLKGIDLTLGKHFQQV